MKAQSEYDELLDGLRSERENRMKEFVERFSKK